MMQKISKRLGAAAAGAAAGSANGLFGAGGGMLLTPGLRRLAGVDEAALFPTAIAVILPLCLASLAVYRARNGLPWAQAWPYLTGGALGGCAAGALGRRIPVRWLHFLLGGLILWGGIRSFL